MLHCHNSSEAAGLLEGWSSLLPGMIKHQLGGKPLNEWTAILQDAEYALSQKLPYSSVSPKGPGNQAVEVGVAPFAIIPSDALGFYVLPSPATLGSAELTFFPQQDSFLPQDTVKFPLNSNCHLSTLDSLCPGTIRIAEESYGRLTD